MTEWLPWDHWSRPQKRIMGKLEGGTEVEVSFNPLAQEWRDRDDNRVTPIEWRSLPNDQRSE